MAKRTSKGNVQRESILDAASSLFVERGFPGTSMYDIADALGVTRTAVYYYFPNKEAGLPGNLPLNSRSVRASTPSTLSGISSCSMPSSL